MEYLVNSMGLRIPEGSIVMISRFPGTKWVVRNGWYTYQGNQYMGWYFSSIPAQVIVPANEEDLNLLTVVTRGDCLEPNPTRFPQPPQPPGPLQAPYPSMPEPTPEIPSDRPDLLPFPPKPDPIPRIDKYLDKTFITVDTVEERDKLRMMSLLPNGKLIRVNKVDDEGAKYYRYDAPSCSFIEIKFENEVSSEDYEELKQSVEELEEYTKELDESFTESINGLHEDISTINSTIDEIKSDDEGIHESITVIQIDIDGIHESIEVINNNIDGIDSSIDDINESIEGIDNKIEGIYETIDNIDTDINGIHSSIDDINLTIDGINESIDIINLEVDTMAWTYLEEG